MRPDSEALNPRYREYIQERAKEVGGVLASIPILDIDDLINNFNDNKVTNVGGGSKSQVFRLDGIVGNQVTTLKILTEDSLSYFLDHNFMDEDYDPLYEYQGVKSVKLARDICATSEKQYGTELALRQIWGHAIGSLRMPDLIDPPVGIWVSHSEDEKDPIVLGYSLPFIEGQSIKINDDTELIVAANKLAMYEKLYVGHRNDSLNAVVNNDTGVKKFVDVEVRF